MAMDARLVEQDGGLRLQGRVDYGNAGVLQAEGLQRLAGRRGELALDVSGLDAPGSVAVAVLLDWLRAGRQAGLAIRVTGIPDKMRAIVRTCGLAEVFALNE